MSTAGSWTLLLNKALQEDYTLLLLESMLLQRRHLLNCRDLLNHLHPAGILGLFSGTHASEYSCQSPLLLFDFPQPLRLVDGIPRMGLGISCSVPLAPDIACCARTVSFHASAHVVAAGLFLADSSNKEDASLKWHAA